MGIGWLVSIIIRFRSFASVRGVGWAVEKWV